MMSFDSLYAAYESTDTGATLKITGDKGKYSAKLKGTVDAFVLSEVCRVVGEQDKGKGVKVSHPKAQVKDCPTLELTPYKVFKPADLVKTLKALGTTQPEVKDTPPAGKLTKAEKAKARQERNAARRSKRDQDAAAEVDAQREAAAAADTGK